MGLFICMNAKCKSIENTNLVSKGIGVADSYPNMHLMDMQGHGDRIYVGNVMGYQYKEEDEILMLCNTCNTGHHHNEFPKDTATEEEITLAKISKYNMITPYDHPDGSIIKDDDVKHGYRLATEEEMVAYVNKRKQSKKALASLFSIAARLGINLPSLTSNNKKDQDPKEKKFKMFLAEYKRQWKQAKKDKDLDKVKHFKEKMDSLK